jgi:kynureninase
MTAVTTEQIAERDRHDPLASFRGEFQLPADIVYLNGNSLGPMPKAAAAAVRVAAEQEWAQGLITSWNGAGWFDLPYRLGAQLATLIGAAADEVAVSDATGLNLFKAVAIAIALNPGRRTLIL